MIGTVLFVAIAGQFLFAAERGCLTAEVHRLAAAHDAPSATLSDPKYEVIRRKAVAEFEDYMSASIDSLKSDHKERVLQALEKTVYDDAILAPGERGAYNLRDRTISISKKSRAKVMALVTLAHESDHLILDLLVRPENVGRLRTLMDELDPRSYLRRLELSAHRFEHGLIQNLWALEKDGVSIAHVALEELEIPREYHELVIEAVSSAKFVKGQVRVVSTPKLEQILNKNPKLLEDLETHLASAVRQNLHKLFLARRMPVVEYASTLVNTPGYKAMFRGEALGKGVKMIVYAALLTYAWHHIDVDVAPSLNRL